MPGPILGGPFRAPQIVEQSHCRQRKIANHTDHITALRNFSAKGLDLVLAHPQGITLRVFEELPGELVGRVFPRDGGLSAALLEPALAILEEARQPERAI